MTNNEMLMAAIEFEEIDVSYDLLYLIQNGIIDPNAEYKDLGKTWDLVDKKVTNEWMSQNLLGFDIKDLYAVRLNVTDWHLYFARNDSEARGYALNKLGTTRFVKMPKEKLLTSFWFEDSRQYKSLKDLMSESDIFPRYALTI